MDTKITFSHTLKNSFLWIKNHLTLSSILLLFSFSGLYIAQITHTPRNFALMTVYLAYTYFFYYLFTRLYFNQKPLWNKKTFIDAFIRMTAIFLFAFAAILILRLGFNILWILLSPLEMFPTFSHFINLTLSSVFKSHYFIYVVYSMMFFVLTGLFFIPSLAWISAVIGGDSSITMSIVRTKGNYARLFGMFFTMFGLLPFISIFLAYDFLFARTFLTSIFTIFQFVFYLQIYQFFYIQKPRLIS